MSIQVNVIDEISREAKMNVTTPVVSVIVPMYNVEKYILQCLESVLSQTYVFFEVICVDDGCTDGTVSKVRQLGDNRIRIVQQINQGLAAARNKGIKSARGIYLAFLDSDDYWHPEKLESHVKHLKENPRVGISYCPSAFVDEDGFKMGIHQTPKLKNIRAKDVLCRNPIGNGSAPVIRRDVFDDIRQLNKSNKRPATQYFDANLRQSEDIELWIRISLNTNWKFEGIKPALTYYRVNAGGLSANTNRQFFFWEKAIHQNRKGHEKFFRQWYPLARAYQMRYLARRAIYSNDPACALKLLYDAFLSSPKIVIEEPIRTCITFGCAFLRFLPDTIYQKLFGLGVVVANKHGHA